MNKINGKKNILKWSIVCVLTLAASQRQSHTLICCTSVGPTYMYDYRVYGYRLCDYAIMEDAVIEYPIIQYQIIEYPIIESII
jgi:hypothetical protein